MLQTKDSARVHQVVMTDGQEQGIERDALQCNYVLNEMIDNWIYIWGSAQFSSSKAYKTLTCHSQAEPIFR
jgi:hypothetical protein